MTYQACTLPRMWALSKRLVDRDSGGRVLLDVATQFYSSHSRLALRSLAFPGFFAGSDRIRPDLRVDQKAAADHRGAPGRWTFWQCRSC